MRIAGTTGSHYVETSHLLMKAGQAENIDVLTDAGRIFEGPVLERIDDRMDYGKTRIAAVGMVEGRALFVIYTMCGQFHRIISARKANRHERTAFYEAIKEDW